MNPDKPTEDRNQREADPISARGPKHVREFVADGKGEPVGRGPTKVTVDELVAKGRTLVDRVESLARRIAGRLGRHSHR